MKDKLSPKLTHGQQYSTFWALVMDRMQLLIAPFSIARSRFGLETHLTTYGCFATSYNNFVYLEQDDAKIAGLNPKDNPTAFGQKLSSYSLTKSKRSIVRSRKNVPKLMAKPLPPRP